MTFTFQVKYYSAEDWEVTRYEQNVDKHQVLIIFSVIIWVAVFISELLDYLQINSECNPKV